MGCGWCPGVAWGLSGKRGREAGFTCSSGRTLLADKQNQMQGDRERGRDCVPAEKSAEKAVAPAILRAETQVLEPMDSVPVHLMGHSRVYQRTSSVPCEGSPDPASTCPSFTPISVAGTDPPLTATLARILEWFPWPNDH